MFLRVVIAGLLPLCVAGLLPLCVDGVLCVAIKNAVHCLKYAQTMFQK